MIIEKLRARSVALTAVALMSPLFAGCSGDGVVFEDDAENIGTTTALMTEYAPNQTTVENFFASNNIVSIKIEMSDAEWLALKTEQPTPQGCQRVAIDPTTGEAPDRYPWRPTTNVTVSGTTHLTTPVSFAGVQIKKKSYCGSISTDPNGRPSLKLKFGSSAKPDLAGAAARDAMGLQYLTLNNSVQDSSYIRQTLGYYLYRMAGMPSPRANYAKVQVVTPTKTENFVYVNVESLRGSFINNPANGFTNRTITQSGNADARAPGNLYEFSIGDDFNSPMLQYVGPEKVSAIQGIAKPDLTYAVNQLNASPTFATFQELFNVDQFTKFWAMEMLLKHWDGYTRNLNNTYVYNDVVATSGAQSGATVDFKLIPWGIDQILQPGDNFKIETSRSLGAQICSADINCYRNFYYNALPALGNSVFSRANLEGPIKARIDALQSQLQGLGINPAEEIKAIRMQLNLIRAATIRLTGGGGPGYYFADLATGEVIHASNSEKVPNYPNYYEIYHRASANDATDRWLLGYTPTGTSLVSEAYNRTLIGSPTLLTSANHPYIFQAPVGTNQPYDAWEIEYEGTNSDFTGAMRLRNVATGGYAHFSGSSDTTPQGRLRVYQGDATRLVMY